MSKIQTVFPVVRYRDPRAGIAWLVDVLGFDERQVHEADGRVVHFELAFGGGVVMGGTAEGDADQPAGPQTVYLATPEVDALYERARRKGAEVIRELADQDYGSRDFAVRDPEGHVWALGTYAPPS